MESIFGIWSPRWVQFYPLVNERAVHPFDSSQRPKLVIQYQVSSSTSTPSVTPSPTLTATPTFTPTATPPPPFTSASFVYDGDGRRVKSTINGVTTYFVGAHYEITGSQVTKYYFAGSQRIAMQTYTVPQNPTLRYLLTDHLGSTSLVTDPSGGLLSRQLYKAWGETRYTNGVLPTKYTYTGQYSYTSDFGLHFYNARWYDSLTGRFAQADTIVPAGVQGLDRYAYVNNSPIVHVDPTGHFTPKEIEEYLKATYGDKWDRYLKAWQSDRLFWNMLLEAQIGDTLVSPTSDLPFGIFVASDDKPFSFEADGLGLESYQGYGPYVLIRENNVAYASPEFEFSDNQTESWVGGTGWAQPLYDYSSGEPVFTNNFRVVMFNPVLDFDNWNPDWGGGAGLPWLATGGGGVAIRFFGPKLIGAASGPAGLFLMAAGAIGYFSNSVLRFDAPLNVNIIPGTLNLPIVPQLMPFDFPNNQDP